MFQKYEASIAAVDRPRHGSEFSEYWAFERRGGEPFTKLAASPPWHAAQAPSDLSGRNCCARSGRRRGLVGVRLGRIRELRYRTGCTRHHNAGGDGDGRGQPRLDDHGRQLRLRRHPGDRLRLQHEGQERPIVREDRCTALPDDRRAEPGERGDGKGAASEGSGQSRLHRNRRKALCGPDRTERHLARQLRHRGQRAQSGARADRGRSGRHRPAQCRARRRERQSRLHEHRRARGWNRGVAQRHPWGRRSRRAFRHPRCS